MCSTAGEPWPDETQEATIAYTRQSAGPPIPVCYAMLTDNAIIMLS